jgi:hypothetical protein
MSASRGSLRNVRFTGELTECPLHGGAYASTDLVSLDIGGEITRIALPKLKGNLHSERTASHHRARTR